MPRTRRREAETSPPTPLLSEVPVERIEETLNALAAAKALVPPSRETTWPTGPRPSSVAGRAADRERYRSELMRVVEDLRARGTPWPTLTEVRQEAQARGSSVVRDPAYRTESVRALEDLVNRGRLELRHHAGTGGQDGYGLPEPKGDAVATEDEGGGGGGGGGGRPSADLGVRLAREATRRRRAESRAADGGAP